MSFNRIKIKEKPVKLKFLKPGYQKKSDYKATVENIGICEVNGNNSQRSQEDAVAVNIPSATSDAFMGLSTQDRALVARETFANLQDNLNKLSDINRCGSCACVATGQMTEQKDGKISACVSTSYVGDSVGFLVVLDDKGKLKSVIPCNPDLHDGNNDAECVAIEQGIGRKKGVIIADRLSAGPWDSLLAVTRAFGDNAHAEYGLLHTPQTTEVAFDLAPGDHAFMVVTCDGAMEYCKGDNSVAKYAQDLGALFEDYPKLSPEALAEKIVDHALEKGSLDNITATVVPLIMSNPAVTVGVFDGHGGASVSQQASAHFSEVFQYNVNHIDALKKKQQTDLNEIQRLLKMHSDNNKNAALNDDKNDSENDMQNLVERRFYQRRADQMRACFKSSDHVEKISQVHHFLQDYRYILDKPGLENVEVKAARDVFLNTYQALLEYAKHHICLPVSKEVVPELQEISKSEIIALGAVGTSIGAFVGALIGSSFPGVGTIVGAIVGGVVGGMVGSAAAYYKQRKSHPWLDFKKRSKPISEQELATTVAKTPGSTSMLMQRGYAVPSAEAVCQPERSEGSLECKSNDSNQIENSQSIPPLTLKNF